MKRLPSGCIALPMYKVKGCRVYREVCYNEKCTFARHGFAKNHEQRLELLALLDHKKIEIDEHRMNPETKLLTCEDCKLWIVLKNEKLA